MTETIREQAERMTREMNSLGNLIPLAPVFAKEADYIAEELTKRQIIGAGVSDVIANIAVGHTAIQDPDLCAYHDIPLVQHKGKLICTRCQSYPMKENE